MTMVKHIIILERSYGNFCHLKSPTFAKGLTNRLSAKTSGASVCIITVASLENVSQGRPQKQIRKMKCWPG